MVGAKNFNGIALDSDLNNVTEKNVAPKKVTNVAIAPDTIANAIAV